MPFHGIAARPDLVDSEASNAVVGVCFSEGNRDRTFWITDPLADANEQQANGLRMVCFIKGHVKMSQITKTLRFCRWWERTTRIRKRGDDE